MTEKTGKKDDQKNKKGKQQEKKRNQENGVKPKSKSNPVVFNDKKKKNKGNNYSSNKSSNHNAYKSSNRKEASTGKSFFRVFLTNTIVISLFLGFIYIVDYEKFVRMRTGASVYVGKFIDLLPPVVVTKGQEAVEYVRPVAELTINKLGIFVNETSTFFNTNPLIKDHWANIRDISSVCSGRLVDYMRLVYTQTTGFCNEFKNKLFS